MNTPNSKIQQEGNRNSTNDLLCHCLRQNVALWPNQLLQASYESLDVIGDPHILSGSLLAVFCSSRCTGEAILRTTKWSSDIADDENRTVIGGFHSAMEKSLLAILLEGKCRLVVCPARNIERFRVPTIYRSPIESGRLAVVSALPVSVRSNSASSSRKRNQLVADLAQQIVVTYASSVSRTEQFALDLLSKGRPVHCLDTGCQTLIAAGAKVLAAAESDTRAHQDGTEASA